MFCISKRTACEGDWARTNRGMSTGGTSTRYHTICKRSITTRCRLRSMKWMPPSVRMHPTSPAWSVWHGKGNTVDIHRCSFKLDTFATWSANRRGGSCSCGACARYGQQTPHARSPARTLGNSSSPKYLPFGTTASSRYTSRSA